MRSSLSVRVFHPTSLGVILVRNPMSMIQTMPFSSDRRPRTLSREWSVPFRGVFQSAFGNGWNVVDDVSFATRTSGLKNGWWLKMIWLSGVIAMLPTDCGKRATISARTGASCAHTTDTSMLAIAAIGRIFLFTWSPPCAVGSLLQVVPICVGSDQGIASRTSCHRVQKLLRGSALQEQL